MQELEAAIYFMKHKPDLNTWSMSGLGSDVYKWFVDTVPVGTASVT